MGRRSQTRELTIWMNGELVGHWGVTSQGQHVLRYVEEWLDSPATRPISLSMPLRSTEAPYQGNVVEAFFDNLLPDSPEIRRRARDRFGCASSSAFDLLAEIGRDCAGAIQLLPEGEDPKDIHKINGKPLDEEDVSNILRSVVTAPVIGKYEKDDFRISIAGAQEKTALLFHEGQWHIPQDSTPSTHIFKLPLGKIGNLQVDMSNSIENEWLCLKILDSYGLETANCEITEFDDQRALIVERYDRKLSPDNNWFLRLPQEDMCQALGIAPGLKYESDGGPNIKDVMSLLLGAQNALEDRKSFFKTNIIFWLLAATDGHAKNFSVFIDKNGSYRLTPLYDVISTYPVLGNGTNLLSPHKIKLAMAAHGKNKHYNWNRILQRHWVSTAKECDFNAQIESVIEDLIADTANVIKEVNNQLPTGFPAEVSDSVLSGLEKSIKKLE